MSFELQNAEKLKLEVKTKFVEYLEKHQQRKTPERFAILDEIYSNKEHFDVETLFEHMKNRNYRVSRATVYNTLDLLLDCGLVIKHQFGKNISRYERSYGFRQHDHLICNHCNEVLEFCDPRLQQIKNTMGELMQFNITNHSLYLFGDPVLDADNNCVSCQKNVKKEN
ncbi:MAG: transcriptional repressor [Sphingobacteriales bacterium]|jgi:Fur family ferric uptake transcriptional regulator|nr:transcriptional repressor [Sphingobacteriales bacterium]